MKGELLAILYPSHTFVFWLDSNIWYLEWQEMLFIDGQASTTIDSIKCNKMYL